MSFSVPRDTRFSVHEARALMGGIGLGAVNPGIDTSLTEVTEDGVVGVWMKKPQPGPAGWVKHSEISKRKYGWVFYTRPSEGAGMMRIAPPDVPSSTEPSHDIMELQQSAAGEMSAMVMQDQPAQTAVPVMQDEGSAMTKAEYKEVLRSVLYQLKLAEAAYIVGNVPPAIPVRPPRPPGVAASDTIVDLEKKIDEYLIVRIPFAMRNAGGTGSDPFARPAGGDIPAPNQPSSFPGEQLSPGAGQPEIPFSPQVMQVTSDAQLSAPIPQGDGGIPTWAWVAIGGVGLVGVVLLLTRKKGRKRG